MERPEDFGSLGLPGMEECPAQKVAPDEQKLLVEHGSALIDAAKKLKARLRQPENTENRLIALQMATCAAYLISFSVPGVRDIAVGTAGALTLAIAATVISYAKDQKIQKNKMNSMCNTARRIANYVRSGLSPKSSETANFTNSSTTSSSARAVGEAPMVSISPGPS